MQPSRRVALAAAGGALFGTPGTLCANRKPGGEPILLHYRSEHAAMVKRLRARIEAWQRRTGGQLGLPA